MEKDEEVPPGGLLIFWGGAGKAGSPTYQGAPVGPLEIPLDGAVVQADPLVLPVLVWGHGGGLGGTAGPQHPQTGLKGWRLFWGVLGGLGEAGKWGGVAGRGQQSPGVPSGPWWLWCPQQ